MRHGPEIHCFAGLLVLSLGRLTPFGASFATIDDDALWKVQAWVMFPPPERHRGDIVVPPPDTFIVEISLLPSHLVARVSECDQMVSCRIAQREV